MVTCLFFICISLTLISNSFETKNSDREKALRYDDGSNRQKLLELDYGVMLSSVEINNKKKHDRSNKKMKLSGKVDVTLKPTKCTTANTITLDPLFRPESDEINSTEVETNDNKLKLDGSMSDENSQNYKRPAGPNVLPDYYVDDN